MMFVQTVVQEKKYVDIMLELSLATCCQSGIRTYSELNLTRFPDLLSLSQSTELQDYFPFHLKSLGAYCPHLFR